LTFKNKFFIILLEEVQNGVFAMNSIDQNYAHAVLFLTVLTIPALLLRNGKITHKIHLIYFTIKKITPLLLTLILFPLQLHTQPTEPILKIETGMHTAPIMRIGIDSAERYFVTGSYDKTIKVWELKTGKLIKTLRPPIGNGKEGMIYAVAISPDGRHIAGGGWTGYEWDDSYSIYIFDINTGKLIKRLSNLPDVILHLTYSKDGKYLAAGLGVNGIRIYKTDDYSLIKEDKDYGDSVYGLDFSYGGKLVTTSLDGYIRLYDENFNLIKKKKAPGGKRPYHISFSPDGSKIAVGYYDTPNVDVLSSDDLEKLYSAYTGDFSGCNFYGVTFSSDGSYLYAGGTCKKRFNSKWKLIIRRWDRAGKGRYIDIPSAENTILHILPLKDGGVVFGSTEPSFGIVDASGKLTLYKGNDIADLRAQWDEFKVSYDGSVIRFGYEFGGESTVTFDAKNREFIIESSVNLLKPITEIRGLKITDWKNSYYPKLNGKTIELKPYELSRSLAISPDGNKFLLGTEWRLRLFDKDGREIWNVPAPSTTWVVNISPNGKVAVAGFDDGTIRWYRMEDGKELFAFFPHKDKKRWVIWTPKGYYDASPGGEELIGWHINNGRDKEADFFPAGRFRDRFYRPDIIAKIFTTYDEDKAIALANEESGKKIQETTDIKKILPPVVTIISPQENEPVKTKEITVRYIIRTPNEEPITSVKFLIDGRPVSQQRGIGLKTQPGSSEEIREATLTIPQRDCEISIIAENKYSASEPATVRVKWVGESEEFVIKPKLYILSVGVSKYMDQSLKLQFASKDASDFAEVMKNQAGKLYSDVVVKLLTDEKATKEDILDGLEWIQRETTSKDVAMIFLAGHGVNDPTGNFYFLPVNVDLDRLKRTGVPFYEIKTTIESIAGKVILFVDACHSGNVMGGRRGEIDITGVINELTSAENGAVIFASSTGRQYSLEDPIWNNGAFTKALVEGLSGKADYTGKGKITINMLELYISERVKELTKGRQTPTVTKPKTIPDFPIAIVK
jgi:WD40 repeat protein